MPKTDDDPLGPGFEWRLRAALDRVQPPAGAPRYASQPAPAVRSWNLAPAALVAAIAALAVLTGFAATGSANPAVWTERAVSTIQSGGHAPQPGGATPASPSASPRPAPSAAPSHEPESEPPSQPKPAESPEPSSGSHESPEPEPSSGGVETGGSPGPTASPTPSDR